MDLIQETKRFFKLLAPRHSIGLLVLVGGCAPDGWYRTTLPQPLVSRSLHRHAQFQVWSHGNMARWHAVMVNRDSLSGIPYNKPLDCDSCRRSISLIEVDSLKKGRPSIANELVAVPAIMLVEVAVCTLVGARNGC